MIPYLKLLQFTVFILYVSDWLTRTSGRENKNRLTNRTLDQHHVPQSKHQQTAKITSLSLENPKFCEKRRGSTSATVFFAVVVYLKNVYFDLQVVRF